MDSVALPAFREIESGARTKTLRLHQVFSGNLFVAHAVDYIHAIRKADGVEEGRTALVRKFDLLFNVRGSRLQNRKFELIDIVNNALKHIRLDQKRYREVEQRYGPVSFSCLVQDEGKVLCMLEGYRFDYAQVVLVPAIEALGAADLRSFDSILRCARGETRRHHGVVVDDGYLDEEDPSTAIDRMIEYCNPRCGECREYEDDCSCATYVFDGEVARFKPLFNASFDFDRVMSQISGAYRRS